MAHLIGCWLSRSPAIKDRRTTVVLIVRNITGHGIRIFYVVRNRVGHGVIAAEIAEITVVVMMVARRIRLRRSQRVDTARARSRELIIRHQALGTNRGHAGRNSVRSRMSAKTDRSHRSRNAIDLSESSRNQSQAKHNQTRNRSPFHEEMIPENRRHDAPSQGGMRPYSIRTAKAPRSCALFSAKCSGATDDGTQTSSYLGA